MSERAWSKDMVMQLMNAEMVENSPNKTTVQRARLFKV